MALTVPDPTAKKGAETSPAKREKSVGDEGAAKP